MLNFAIISLGLVNNLSKEIEFFVKIISEPRVNKIAKKAYEDNTTLKKAANDLNLLSEDDFDKLVIPEKMTGN